jgi:hypothetical protein
MTFRGIAENGINLFLLLENMLNYLNKKQYQNKS